MLVKKFEAPTLQEALKVIKQELGPEAIILSTKNKKPGFGLMQRPSVEITAAVSQRQLQKKKKVEKVLPDNAKQSFSKTSAKHQADSFDKYDRSNNRESRYTRTANAQKAALTKNYSKGSGAYSDSAPAMRYQLSDDQPRGQRGSDGMPQEELLALINDSPSSNHVNQGIANDRSNRYSAEQGYSHQQTNRTAPTEEIPIENSSLQNELRNLKSIIQEISLDRDFITQSGEFEGLSLGFKEAYQELLCRDFSKKYSFEIVRDAVEKTGSATVDDPNQIKAAINKVITESLPIHRPQFLEKQEGRVVLVGSHGVGKTITAAKLAMTFKSPSVVVVTLEETQGGVDFWSRYSSLVNIEVVRASTEDSFRDALYKLRNQELLIIDTPSVNFSDRQSLANLQKFTSLVKSPEIILCLDSLSKDEHNIRTCKSASVLKPASTIFSKSDLLSNWGSVYNVSKESKLPVGFWGTGVRIPDDLDVATPEAFIDSIWS